MTTEAKIKMIFSIYLHKTKFEFNAIKYNYNIPQNFTSNLKSFYNKNQYNFESYLNLSENNCKLRAIINFFSNNGTTLKKISDSEYNDFVYDLKHYKNNITLFLKDTKLEDFTKERIYRMYLKKEIPFYIYWYSFKYLNLGTNIMIKESLKSTYKLLLFFNFFDVSFIERVFLEKKKEISLSN